MPVKPVDFRSKTLELAEANGWFVNQDKDASSQNPYRVLMTRGVKRVIARFSKTDAFAFAHTSDRLSETISRYATLEQILTAPEDSVPVMPKSGELTGSVVRHQAPNQKNDPVADDESQNDTDWPMLVTTGNSIAAQRQDPETREWVTHGLAAAYESGEARWWVVNRNGAEIARIGGEGSRMNERDMRRAVVAIMREMF